MGDFGFQICITGGPRNENEYNERLE